MSGGGPRYEPREKVPKPEDLVLGPRLERIDEVLAGRTRNVTVVLDKLEDAFNMAAVLRTCEAFGIQDVHVIRNPDVPFKPNVTVTQGCDKWLDLHPHEDFAACRTALKAAGYRIWVSAAKPKATSLFDLRFDEKVALVLGNERFGVTPDVVDGADGVFWIPMAGFSQSLNISAAASACLTRAVSWRAEHLKVTGDLPPQEHAVLRERFQRLSIKQHRRLYKEPKG
jgi:tRNA (guanosine-2'-O-)-methyltransferase